MRACSIGLRAIVALFVLCCLAKMAPNGSAAGPVDASAAHEGAVRMAAGQRVLDVHIVGVLTKEYDGLVTAEPESIFFDGAQNGDDVDVSATIYYSDADAGVGKSIDRVELSLSGADRGEYRAQLVTPPQMGTVLPYSRAACEEAVIRLPEMTGRVFEVDLAELLLLDGPGTPGMVQYTGPTQLTGDTAIFREAPLVRDGFLRIALESGVGAGNSASLYITVNSANYQAVEACVRIEIYAERSITGVTAPDQVYTGAPYQPLGQPHIGGVPVADPRYRYTGRAGTQYESDSAPTDAGEYTLQVSAPQEQNVEGQWLEFSIFRAPLTVTPVGREITVGQAVPEQYAFRVEPLLGGDTAAVLSPQPQARADVGNSASPGVYPIRLSNRPEADNYDITAGEGQLTIRAQAGEGELYKAPAPGASGWYTAPVTVVPAQPARFGEIALHPDGPFSTSVTIRREGSGGVALYFRGSAGTAGDVIFPCRLDSTPPAIAGALLNAQTGAVTVSATDTLSGIGSLQLLGPDGDREVAGQNGNFVVTASGVYTVVATDIAGNTATQAYELILDAPDDNGEDSDGGAGDASTGTGMSGNTFSSSRSGSSSGSSGSGLRDGESTSDFWNTIGERIRTAEPGGVVRVMSAVQNRIPASILRALRESGVTLRIIRPDGDILLPGNRIPALGTSAGSYSVEEVLAMLLPEEQKAAPDTDSGAPAPLAAWAPSTAPAIPAPAEPQTADSERQDEFVEAEPVEPEISLPDQPAAVPIAEPFYTDPIELPPDGQSGRASPWGWMIASLLGTGALSLAGFAVKMFF